MSAAPMEEAAPSGRLPRLLLGLRDDHLAVPLEQHLRLVSHACHPARPHRAGRGKRAARTRRGCVPDGPKTRDGRGAARPADGRCQRGRRGALASGKDKALLRRHNPHTFVLDGAVLVATALGARETVIAVSADAVLETRRLGAAIGERRRQRLDRVNLRVESVPARFVTGEETALLQAVAGRPAKPTRKPPYPFERGLGGQPTLVQNAETLAQLALIARYGPGWFRAAGSVEAPGTALVTLSGAIARPGVHEIELGWTLGRPASPGRRRTRAVPGGARRRLLRRLGGRG